MDGEQSTALPEAEAAAAARRERLDRIADTLARLSHDPIQLSQNGCVTGWIIGITAGLLAGNLYLEEKRAFVSLLAAVICYLLYSSLEAQYFARIRDRLNQRIIETQLISRMANSWDEFPSIPEFPSRIMRWLFGSKPVTDADWVVHIAGNLPRYVDLAKSPKFNKVHSLNLIYWIIGIGCYLASLIHIFLDTLKVSFTGDIPTNILIVAFGSVMLLLNYLFVVMVVAYWRNPLKRHYAYIVQLGFFRLSW
jgi:hypothetical protein